METEDHDPYIEQFFDDLLKKDYKSIAPDESSATWEIITAIYKKERSRRRKTMLFRLCSAVAAALIVGAIIYKLNKGDSKDWCASGSGI